MNINIISFVARSSGSGKTHIIELLIAELSKRGLKVAAIKHSSHMPEFDIKGKDTYKYRKSGASRIMIFSPHGMMMADDSEQSPWEIADKAGKGMDIVLLEGYKDGPFPKIEVYNPTVYQLPLCKEFEGRFIGLVSDTDPGVDIPRFGFSEVAKLADFILSYPPMKIKDAGNAC
jgi:molybdopterin-guanine dinucleotide biosynthesis adapter protein